MKIIEFKVQRPEGVLQDFPLDMLRYDNCWPATTDDAMTINEISSKDIPAGKPVQVLIRGLTCHAARWQSFGWLVVDRNAPLAE